MPIYLPSLMERESEARVKVLTVDARLFVQLLQGLRWPHLVEARGIPDDAEVLSATVDPTTFRVRLLVKSETFEVVKTGQQAPDFTVDVRIHWPEQQEDGSLVFHPPEK